LIIRRLIVPLTFAVVTIHAGQALRRARSGAACQVKAAPASNARRFRRSTGARLGAPSAHPRRFHRPVAAP
jgi:hypothetical protein